MRIELIRIFIVSDAVVAGSAASDMSHSSSEFLIATSFHTCLRCGHFVLLAAPSCWWSPLQGSEVSASAVRLLSMTLAVAAIYALPLPQPSSLRLPLSAHLQLVALRRRRSHDFTAAASSDKHSEFIINSVCRMDYANLDVLCAETAACAFSTVNFNFITNSYRIFTEFFKQILIIEQTIIFDLHI